jgi:hypothetical protein
MTKRAKLRRRITHDGRLTWLTVAARASAANSGKGCFREGAERADRVAAATAARKNLVDAFVRR